VDGRLAGQQKQHRETIARNRRRLDRKVADGNHGCQAERGLSAKTDDFDHAMDRSEHKTKGFGRHLAGLTKTPGLAAEAARIVERVEVDERIDSHRSVAGFVPGSPRVQPAVIDDEGLVFTNWAVMVIGPQSASLQS
jgi:hypothetical protein